MAERRDANVVGLNARLRLVRKVAELSQPGGRTAAAEQRLISPSNAAIRRSLQEQTRMALATLTPREQQVLRMRFGIERPDDPPTAPQQHFVLRREQIYSIEARALRKLRHPSHRAHLRSVI